MADHPEGLGPDSDDDFVPWNSNPLQPAVEEDAAAASAQIPVETRDEVELESCRALAREDALSYLEHMKFVRMNAMRTRMEARKAILAATAEMAAKKRQEYIEEHLTLEDVLAAGGLKPPVIPQLK